MRASQIALACLLGLGMVSCTRSDTPRRDDSAARQAGRDAYRATQEIKRGAKEAGKELRNAGKELREGWNDAKRNQPARRDEPVRRDRDKDK
jgi:hypothetical protein